MSLAVDRVQTYQVWDPVLLINDTRNMMVLRGGSQITYKDITATSSNRNVVQFTAITPTLNTIIDRKIVMKMPIDLRFTCDDIGNLCLQSEKDAFRAHPIMSVMTNMEAQINTTSVSIQMADVIHPLSRFGENGRLQGQEYSIFPSMLDQYQIYGQGENSFDNPLGGPGKKIQQYQVPRGAFPMKITLLDGTGTQNNTEARVRADLFEYLYLSPFSFGKFSEPGMIGVQTLDFTMNFNSSLNRMWSHIPSPPPPALQKNLVFDNVNSRFDNPTLLFRYITPPIGVPIAPICQIPFFKVQRYKTGQALANLANGASSSITTNNIQLTEVPRRMYIYVREVADASSFLESDVYFNIENLNINYANLTGQLSSAAEVQLYRMTLKNGYNGSWQDYHALDVNNFEGLTPINVKPGWGSICAVEFGTDLALQPGLATSVSSNQNLQMNILFRNIQGVAFTGNVEAVILTISEGIFTIRNNTAIPQTAVLTPLDVLNSIRSPMKDYNEIRYSYGSSFWDGVKHFFGQVWDTVKGAVKNAPAFIKAVAPIARVIAEAAPVVAPLIGLGDVGGAHMYGAQAYGYGGRRHYKKRRGGRKRKYKKRRKGGVVVGGAKLSNAQLKRLLMKM